MPALNQIEDKPTRDKFRELDNSIDDLFFKKFRGRHIEVSVDSAVSDNVFVHRLGFVPQDMWVTGVVPYGVSVLLNNETATSSQFTYSTSGACTFRAIIGLYRSDER